MCLLLAIIHSTFPKVLYWVGMHFLFTDGKIDRKRWSVLPGTNGLVRCLFKALGTAFFTWPGGSLLERHWTGLKAALRPLALLARGEQAEERPGSQLPLWPLFQMAVKITPRGQTFSSAFCPLTPADFEMTGFMFKGGSAATIWYASLGTCLLFDTSLSFSCKDSCACLQRNGTYCIPVHIHVAERAGFLHWWVGGVWLLLVEETFPAGCRGFAIVLFQLAGSSIYFELTQVLMKSWAT